jgi:hypothetical protein
LACLSIGRCKTKTECDNHQRMRPVVAKRVHDSVHKRAWSKSSGTSWWMIFRLEFAMRAMTMSRNGRIGKSISSHDIRICELHGKRLESMIFSLFSTIRQGLWVGQRTLWLFSAWLSCECARNDDFIQHFAIVCTFECFWHQMMLTPFSTSCFRRLTAFSVQKGNGMGPSAWMASMNDTFWNVFCIRRLVRRQIPPLFLPQSQSLRSVSAPIETKKRNEESECYKMILFRRWFMLVIYCFLSVWDSITLVPGIGWRDDHLNAAFSDCFSLHSSLHASISSIP